AGGWDRDEALRGLLPVDLGNHGQQEKPTRMLPTRKGLGAAPYILKLDSQPDVAAAWKKLANLDGYTRLQLKPAAEGKPGEKAEERRTTEEVLARAEGDKEDAGDPLLVMKTYAGKQAKDKKVTEDLARVLVFAGDTTYRWVRDEEGLELHRRFWKQVAVWLAR